MNNLRIYLSSLALCLLVLFSCSKGESDYSGKNLTSPRSKDLTTSNLLTKNWQTGTYLVYSSEEEIRADYHDLQVLKTSEFNSVSNEDMDAGEFNPELDKWESENGGFISMRKAYELHSYYGLESGLDPSKLRGVPIIDDALATIISPDGLVQVGEEIQYFSPLVYASAPITLKDRLRDIVENGSAYTPKDKKDGIEVMSRSGSNCNADFSFDINQNSGDVFVTYTGTDISGGDKTIVWSVEGNNTYTDQTSFTHNYSTPGQKTICVTYTETGIVKDTTYNYHLNFKDSTYVIPNSEPARDTTVRIRVVERVAVVNEVVRIICTDNQCRTFELGDCDANFDFTVGFDNEVNFVDQSTTMFGNITGWQWNFGDGTTSTERNPTHKYPCDREFEVTLIIFSDQCPNGSASTSRTISASGAQCCDKNPQSSWKEELHPTDDKKKIRYRYDMGTNWNWLLDQDFKARIVYYEHRKGGLFGSTKWRKTDGNLDVDFDGNVYASDDEDCNCISPRALEAQPASKQDNDHTFKDALSASAFSSSKTHWMKETSPVDITYKVDGTTYVVQNCQSTPGFHCE